MGKWGQGRKAITRKILVIKQYIWGEIFFMENGGIKQALREKD